MVISCKIKFTYAIDASPELVQYVALIATDGPSGRFCISNLVICHGDLTGWWWSLYHLLLVLLSFKLFFLCCVFFMT